MKGVTSSYTRAFDASCHHEFEKACFCLLWNHPKSVMHVRSILWFDRLIIFIPYVSLAHQATDWFVQGKGVLSASPEGTRWICTKLRYPRWWFPLLNSVVFYYKTTLWSCLSWTTCSHVVAEPAHVLELAIVIHFPRILQRHLVDLCCKLSFFFLDLMSLGYPDTNQIWISGRYDGLEHFPRTIILVPR